MQLVRKRKEVFCSYIAYINVHTHILSLDEEELLSNPFSLLKRNRDYRLITEEKKMLPEDYNTAYLLLQVLTELSKY